MLIQWSTSLTSVLTSRFLINLQLAKRRQEGSFQSVAEGTELVFEPQTSGGVGKFVESMGAPLYFDDDDSGESTEVEA